MRSLQQLQSNCLFVTLWLTHAPFPGLLLISSTISLLYLYFDQFLDFCCSMLAKFPLLYNNQSLTSKHYNIANFLIMLVKAVKC